MTNKKDPDELREKIEQIIDEHVPKGTVVAKNEIDEEKVQLMTLIVNRWRKELLKDFSALIATEQDKAILKELKILKAEWDKWLAFDDDDPNDPVPLKDIIAFFEERIKELEGRLGK
jgi:hypothetical protein